MIFEKESLSFNILDVLELKQGAVNMFNGGRSFDALSFRFRADTEIKTKTHSFPLKDNSVSFVPASVDYSRISTHDHLIVIHFNALNYFSKEVECIYPKNHEKIGELFKKILMLWNEKGVGYRHACSALLYEIFSLIYKEAHKESGNLKIEKSVKFILDNFTDPNITISLAAKRSNVSEVYFRKIFKNEFGISPKKYLINARIRLAVNLIESGYYSLSEIAAKCGFTDYKYFSTEFSRIMGIPPSKYHYSFNKP